MNRRTFLHAATVSAVSTLSVSGMAAPNVDGHTLPGTVPQTELGGTKVRPVISGVAEIPEPYQLNYGTGGVLAERDGNSGPIDWMGDDDLLRVSNRHIYGAGLDGEPLDEPKKVKQPALNGEVVGEVVGLAPFPRFDIGFRTLNSYEHGGIYGFESLHSGVASVDSLTEGDELVTNGARSDRTTGEYVTVESAFIRYSEETTRRIPDCIRTTRMTDSGDSGSAVLRKSDDKLVGFVFAGSDRTDRTWLIPAERVESELSVSFLSKSDHRERVLEYCRNDDGTMENSGVLDCLTLYNDSFSPMPRVGTVLDALTELNENQ